MDIEKVHDIIKLGLKEEFLFADEISDNEEIEIKGHKHKVKEMVKSIKKVFRQDEIDELKILISLKLYFIKDVAELIFEYSMRSFHDIVFEYNSISEFLKVKSNTPLLNFSHSIPELAWLTYQTNDEFKRKVTFEEFLPKYEKIVIEDKKDDYHFDINPLSGSLMVSLKNKNRDN